MVAPRASARGGIGTRGPGETQLETDRRLVRNKISSLKRQIEQVRKQRALHRRRRARQGVPVVALVGYTNAGQEHADARALGRRRARRGPAVRDARPVTRRIHLPSGGGGAADRHRRLHPEAADAAGRRVPRDARGAGGGDLLLHVVDITHPDAEEQARTVEADAARAGAGGSPAADGAEQD